MNKEKQLTRLYSQILNCTECPLKGPGPVAGIGSLNPKILFVGEAPGATEAEHGLPFVGDAGALLQGCLTELGIFINDDIFVTNLVKHRPASNRNPTLKESKVCHQHYLLHEINILKPELIVTLGKVPTSFLMTQAGLTLPRSGFRNLLFEYMGIPVRTTWHPAYILHSKRNNPELSYKISKQMMEDIREAYDSVN